MIETKRFPPMHLLVHRFVKMINFGCMFRCPYCKLDFGNSHAKVTTIKEKRAAIDNPILLDKVCSSKIGISFAAIGDALATKDSRKRVESVLDMSKDSVETHISTANDDLNYQLELLDRYPNLTISRTIDPLCNKTTQHNNKGVKLGVDRLYYSIILIDGFDTDLLDPLYINSDSVSFTTEDFPNDGSLSNYIKGKYFEKILNNKVLIDKIVRDDYLLYGFQYDCQYNAKLDNNCYRKSLSIDNDPLQGLLNYRNEQLIDFNESCIDHCVDLGEKTSSKFYFYRYSDKYNKYKDDIDNIDELYNIIYGQSLSSSINLDIISSLVPNTLTKLDNKNIDLTITRSIKLISWKYNNYDYVEVHSLSEFLGLLSPNSSDIICFDDRINKYFKIVICGISSDLYKKFSNPNKYRCLFDNDEKLLLYYIKLNT